MRHTEPVTDPASVPPAPASTIAAAELSVRPAGRNVPILERVSLRVAPGEVVGVLGRSGAGKTTLLHALLGLIPWARPGEVHGTVLLGREEIGDLDPAQRAAVLGAALDRPAAQLFLPTPRDELRAAVRHRPAPLLTQIVACLGVSSLLDRRTLELSSGERQRVALACALASAPRPVLLDEPTAHLDGEGSAALANALDMVRGHGGAVLLIEQAGWRLAGSVDRWLALQWGRLTPAQPPAPPAIPAPDPAPAAAAGVLELRGVALEQPGALLLEEVNLALAAGEIVLIRAPNGAGKSTLLRALAGRHPLTAGERRRDGRRVTRPGGVALMLPEAARQLFAPTVTGEVFLSGASRAEAARVLRRHGLENLAGRPPWTLSRGEQQRLLHAALDVTRPTVMLLDEPAQGLDPDDLARFAELLKQRAARGRAILVASHREELAALAHRRLTIRNRRLVEEPSCD